MIINIPLIAIIISIAACIYASYSDLRWGIIPNKLTFPLIGVGILLNGIYYITTGNLLLLLGTLIVTLLVFLFGYLFWKMGAWAGGDVKLFTALAALIPFYPTILNYQLFNINFPITASYPFPLTLIINSILSMLPFLLIYVSFIVIKNKPHLIGELLSPVKDYRKNIVLTLVITSSVTLAYFITPYFQLQILIVISVLTFLLSLIISRLPNQVKAVLISLVTVFALIHNLPVTIIGITLMFISLTIFGMLRVLLTTVSREALQDDYHMNELKEGMIPAYNLYEKDGEVYIDDKKFTDKIKTSVKTGDLTHINNSHGKILIYNRAAGLNLEDISLLKKLVNEGRMNDSYRVKKGVPFAPSIFIGLIISLFIGDLAFILLKILNALLY
ncbi:MAG: A24 family peptidase C-terminal domain-containing protein [Methanobacterium sp.]